MKKIVVCSFPLWISAGIIMFAFAQTFGIGLVIMLGLVVIQLIFGTPDDLSWGKFKKFDFGYLPEDDKNCKWLNIYFNLARVATIISTMAFLSKSEIMVNNFGDLGITIAIVVYIIALILLFAIRDPNNYEYVRGALTILVIILAIIFFYLYFQTQLVWILVFLIWSLSFGDGFQELDNETHGVFCVFTPVSLGVASIVSTIIQFWEEISSFLSNILTVLSALNSFFFSLKLFFIPIWELLLIFIIAIVILKIIKALIKKRNELRKKAEEEKENFLAAQRLENLKNNEKSRAMSLLNCSDAVIFKNDILFVVENNNLFSKAGAAQILTRAELFDSFVEVSDIKKQIVYSDKLKMVLEVCNTLYNQLYDDKIINNLADVICDFRIKVRKFASYKGAAELLAQIDAKCKDFPKS